MITRVLVRNLLVCWLNNKQQGKKKHLWVTCAALHSCRAALKNLSLLICIDKVVFMLFLLLVVHYIYPLFLFLFIFFWGRFYFHLAFCCIFWCILYCAKNFFYLLLLHVFNGILLQNIEQAFQCLYVMFNMYISFWVCMSVCLALKANCF